MAANELAKRTLLAAVRLSDMLCEAKNEGANGCVPERHLWQGHYAGHDRRQCRPKCVDVAGALTKRPALCASGLTKKRP